MQNVVTITPDAAPRRAPGRVQSAKAAVHDDTITGDVVMIGNFPPRRCGIATFTRDLFKALQTADPLLACDVLAMTDKGAYDYPDAVALSLRQRELPDYVAAAGKLNAANVKLICLQHEYGIFGGAAGDHLLALLSRARAPLVTTLHTVLTSPDADQRRVMLALIERSARVVVMAEKGRRILREVYNAPLSKIVVIPHGAPDVPFEETAAHKAALDLAGRTTLLTFGLLAPNKGIDFMIRALPAIAARHPDALYVVLGATHPHLIAHEGEAYRERLIALAGELGVTTHVRFVNEYVDDKKLLAYLAAADLYVTPYLTEAQITSGTLSYAAAMGKAIVSTPYWHACELLAGERGVLTSFADSRALAKACNDLLSDDAHRERLRRKAYAAGRHMIWPQVAKRYLEVFEEAKTMKREAPNRLEPRARARDLPRPDMGGVERLTDGCGMLQHSRFRVPDRAHGYCLDDNARALMLMNRLGAQGFEPARTSALAEIYAAFVQSAWNEPGRCFRNFMAYDRVWLEERGSEDSFGRGFWALGETALHAPDEDLKRWAGDMIRRTIGEAARLAPLRSRAFVTLGLCALDAAGADEPQARALLHRFAQELARALHEARREGWTWFEPALAYDNARLPEALIRAGGTLRAPALVERGLSALDWLCARQTAPSGVFRPVPTAAMAKPAEDQAEALFDQQPLEAAATIEACAAAFEATSEARWLREAERAFAWFTGENDLGQPLGLPGGQCYDGLTPRGPNLNQGAESVLAHQFAIAEMALLHARVRRAKPAAR